MALAHLAKIRAEIDAEAAGDLHAPALTVSSAALLVNGSDRSFRELVHALFAFKARHEAIREGHATAIGLVGIEYTVLISISHLSEGGGVGVRELAEHLHLSGAFVTTVSSKLLAKGLIDKKIDTADRRRVRLTLTRAGHALLDELSPVQQRVNDVQFDCLGAKEFQSLLDMIDRLVQSGDKAVALQRYLAANVG
jgi:MarR family transcriptional regulator, organic hydroperoxide resistance regulator